MKHIWIIFRIEWVLFNPKINIHDDTLEQERKIDIDNIFIQRIQNTHESFQKPISSVYYINITFF